MDNLKTFDELNEGTMISKRNMDLDDFRKQGTFFEDKQAKLVTEAVETKLFIDENDLTSLLNGEEVVITSSQGPVKVMIESKTFHNIMDILRKFH
jgi:hypothetical protein